MGKLYPLQKPLQLVAITYFQLLAKFTGMPAETNRHEYLSRHFSGFDVVDTVPSFFRKACGKSPFPLANSCVIVDDPTLERHHSLLMNGNGFPQ